MSIPVHFNGSLLNIMGGGTASPPPGATFNKIVFSTLDAEDRVFIGQLHFGTSGSGGGFSSDKTSFLAAHPGLTLQDFSGIAPPGGQAAIPAFTGFTVTSTTPGKIDDSAFLSSPFCAIDDFVSAVGSNTLTLTFSPAVNAVGFQVVYFDGLADIQFFNGATLLDSELFATDTVTTFATFAGYAT